MKNGDSQRKADDSKNGNNTMSQLVNTIRACIFGTQRRGVVERLTTKNGWKSERFQLMGTVTAGRAQGDTGKIVDLFSVLRAIIDRRRNIASKGKVLSMANASSQEM